MYSCSIHRSILRTISLVLNGFAVAYLFSSTSLSAQEQDWPSNADAHPGEIVYSRAVPYGTATRRFSQGEAHTVAPDQSRLIQDSILQGLTPMTNIEQAAVSAPLLRSIQTGQDAIETGTSTLAGALGSGDFTRSESGPSATGNIGNTVSQGLGGLSTAIAVIGNTTGSGK